MRSNTRIYLVALVFFAAGLGFLLYTGLNQGSAYHLDVGEALGMPADKLQSVRVFGTVGAEGIARSPDALGVRFLLQDQQNPAKVMEVVYKGAVPDAFKPGTELYAEGSCLPGTKILKAEGLTTTCPSKYRKENRQR